VGEIGAGFLDVVRVSSPPFRAGDTEAGATGGKARDVPPDGGDWARGPVDGPAPVAPVRRPGRSIAGRGGCSIL